MFPLHQQTQFSESCIFSATFSCHSWNSGTTFATYRHFWTWIPLWNDTWCVRMAKSAPPPTFEMPVGELQTQDLGHGTNGINEGEDPSLSKDSIFGTVVGFTFGLHGSLFMVCKTSGVWGQQRLCFLQGWACGLIFSCIILFIILITAIIVSYIRFDVAGNKKTWTISVYCAEAIASRYCGSCTQRYAQVMLHHSQAFFCRFIFFSFFLFWLCLFEKDEFII